MLKIYNSSTRQKETFQPIHPGKVNIYVCGVTVYDYCHIGHARTYTAFDAIIRYLKWRGYQVTHVRNITDIEDKIIKRANENNEDYQAVVDRFIKAIYDRLPCKLIDETKDNLQRLQTELQIVAKNAGISASKIRSLAMKHLLIATKIQLEKELDIKKDDCPKLYKDTYLEICKAEKSDLEAKESAKEEIWSKSFASVVTTAKLYLSVDELKHSDITSKSNESKRPISSLFLPQQPITSALRKREFCHQFELIEKFIPEKTAQLKAMSKAVMR